MLKERGIHRYRTSILRMRRVWERLFYRAIIRLCGCLSKPFSSLKRLTKKGYVIKTDAYEIEDPFFRRWIVENLF
jgi:hypothetical protein